MSLICFQVISSSRIGDLSWLYPGCSFEACASRWLPGATRIAVLTKGGQGATAITRSLEISVPAVEAQVVDTVGAGDAFNAGILSGLRQRGFLDKKKLQRISDEGLRFSMEFAAQVTAITVSRAGADTPWRHELQSQQSNDVVEHSGQWNITE